MNQVDTYILYRPDDGSRLAAQIASHHFDVEMHATATAWRILHFLEFSGPEAMVYFPQPTLNNPVDVLLLGYDVEQMVLEVVGKLPYILDADGAPTGRRITIATLSTLRKEKLDYPDSPVHELAFRHFFPAQELPERVLNFGHEKVLSMT